MSIFPGQRLKPLALTQTTQSQFRLHVAKVQALLVTERKKINLVFFEWKQQDKSHRYMVPKAAERLLA